MLVFDSDPDENLLEELRCPHFDDVLIALRKAFSLTFPRNPFIVGLQEALKEIRRVGIDALRTIPEVLDGFGLKPVPTASTEMTDTKAYVFRYCLAREADLQLKAKYESKTQKLVNMLNRRPADEVVGVLREVVSSTFEEMHNEAQHEDVLRGIRERIGSICFQRSAR